MLSLTLACMPTKSFNLEWDLDDPNEMVPIHEAGGKAVIIPKHASKTQDTEQQRAPRKESVDVQEARGVEKVENGAT